MGKKLMLIDGNNLAYRAYYALPDSIATSSGTTTNAVLGFTSMLLKLIEEQNPDSIIAAFDSKGPTFRHDLFADYKVNRKEMPALLSGQLPLIEEVLKAFNIAVLKKEGYEADDIIATIVEKAKDYSQIFIVSGDKDMLQLVSDKVKVIVNRKGITDTMTYGPKTVKENYGVDPERIKDLLALMGDSSDNIPGIPGIGPKTAVKLLKKYKDIGELYQNIEHIENKRLKNLLEENRDMAFKSLGLTRLKIDPELDLSGLLKTSYTGIDMAAIEKLFNSLEFRSLYKRLRSANLPLGKSTNRPEQEAGRLKNLVNITGKSLLEKLAGEIKGKLYMLYANRKQQSILFYCGSDNVYRLGLELLDKQEIKQNLQKVFSDTRIAWCGYDFKNIYKVFKRYGCQLSGKVIDFKILYLLLNQHQADIGLDDLIYKVWGTDISSTEQQPGQLELSFKQEDECKLDLKRISIYPKIEDVLVKEIKKESLERVYKQIEEPLIKVLADMEYTGVYVDKEYLQSLIGQYRKDIERLKQEIYEICGQRFNINSTQQLASILYEKLGLPATKKTKTGYSTDVSALQAIKDRSPVIEKILDYREKTKLKNTYLDVLPKLIDPTDGRVHATYNQMGTTTGRISSNDPNLQNIPIRTALGRQIRKAFIPGTGYELILAADYSQIELRILAHLSEDQGLIEAFSSGEDIHARTASEVFNVDYEQVDDTLRRKAKAINFGIIYGMTKYGLMSRLSISEDEAEQYIALYFARFPRVKSYLEYLIKEAYRCGYATTIFGRKRKITELGSSNLRLRNLGERLAVNTPIQGSAADIMKLSTILLYDRLKKKGLDSNIILHVHDELVLELKQKELEEVRKLVRQSMEGCIKLKVGLKVDIKTGKNWYI